MDEIADQEEYYPGVQVFHPHQYIIDLKVQLVTESQNGKKSYKIDTIKKSISKYDYHNEFSNGEHLVLEYQDLVNILNKYDKDDVESWKFKASRITVGRKRRPEKVRSMC